MKVSQALDVSADYSVSMVEPTVFQTLSDALSIIRKQRHKEFGGLQVVLCGDFVQLPPVAPGKPSNNQRPSLSKSGRKIAKATANPHSHLKFCFETPAWQTVIPPPRILTIVHRQTDSGESD